MSEKNELVLINDEAFGSLIQLPTLYKESEASVVKAEAVADQHYEKYKAKMVDLQTVPFEEMEAILTPMRTIRVKLTQTEKKLFDGRSPHTRKMDQIAGMFIGLEKRIKLKADLYATAENMWQTEIARRNKKAADDLAAAQKKTQDKINKVAEITKAINAAFVDLLVTKITAMTTKFYDPSTDLPKYCAVISKFAYTFDHSLVKNWNLTGEADHIAQALLDTKEYMSTEYPRRMKEEAAKLVEKLPGRLAEIAKGENSEGAALKEVVSSASSLIEQMNEEVDTTKTVSSLNAAFVPSSSATPVMQSSGAKGKTTKKKYVAETHAALQVIAQSWFTHNFKLLSIEEVNKKLSFMRTAADERLNAGEPRLESPGLTVIDDIRTRATV
jgi:hypothetical protein